MSDSLLTAHPTPLLLDGWPAVHAAGLQAVGGKAWTLAQLSRHHFAVPDGLVIPAAAYRGWLADTGLQPALLAASRQPVAEQAAALEPLVRALRSHPLGRALAQALRALLTRGAWRGQALAVRSSSPHEDSAAASFAGIHASFLNVRDEAGWLAAIVGVWTSLWTPAAVAYRQRMGLAHEEAAMAVLVMPLVAAQASGIAFTCDPLSGREDRLRIHANWQLGESLVSGQAAGDDIELGETVNDELVLLSYTVGSKAVSCVPLPGGGTRSEANRPEQAAAPVLSHEQALALGEQLRLAALALDLVRPAFDCEWAWDGERFWLLQARPVTTQARCTYPALQDQPDIWSRGNTRDVMPEPLSPIDWSVLRKTVNLLLEAPYRLCGFALHPGVQRAGVFHGCVYLNTSVLQWEGFAGVGLPPSAVNKLMGGHQPEIRVPDWGLGQRLRRAMGLARFVLKEGALRRRGRRAVDAAMARARRALEEDAALPIEDAAAVAATLRAHRGFIRAQHPLHFLQTASAAGLSMLVDLLEGVLPGEGHAMASALLAGGPPSVTARQGYDLIALARQAMADPQARAWLDRRNSLGGSGDWRTGLPSDHPFRRAMEDFLVRYGHRGIYESYLRNPRWRECPDYLIDSLSHLAATDLPALLKRQEASVAAALQRLHAVLPWWKRGWLRSVMRSAKRETNDREAARSALIASVEPVRRLLLRLGAHWTACGWLSATDDIFLLAVPEILAVLDARHSGAALPALVADRQALFADWTRQAERAPDVVMVGAAAPVQPARSEAPVGDVLRGVAVGSGVATGVARVLRSPAEGRRLRQGDILVVPSTDPAWTPLFLNAGGLVMETGGFLSHGAIVAREFGIPAVVNLPGILTQLREGETLRVDGHQGTVTRLGPSRPDEDVAQGR